MINEIRELLAHQRFKEARAVSLTLLSQDPFSPEMWGLLAECLLQMGNGKMARMCFQRAWLLDPLTKWGETVMRAGDKAPPHGMKDLAVEAVLAVPKQTVAALVLFRDDIRTIEDCLSALLPAVDQIVAVDTGSSDGSSEVVRRLGLDVYEFQWCDDFSAARNFGLSLVRADWVIAIDADEILYTEDVGSIREAAGVFAKCQRPTILRIVQMNKVGNVLTAVTSQSRMFPTFANLSWQGRIHEVITSEKGMVSSDVFRPVVRIRVYHDGYDAAAVDLTKKYERNISLLKKTVKEYPTDPVHYFYLGRESMFLNRLDEAIGYLQEAESLARGIEGYSLTPDILRRLISAYWQKRDVEKASVKIEQLVTSYPDYPDGWYWRAELQLLRIGESFRGIWDDVSKAIEAAKNYKGVTEYDTAVGTWKSTAQLAEVKRLSGDLVSARQLYRSVLEQVPNLEVIRRRLTTLEEQATRIAKDIRTGDN